MTDQKQNIEMLNEVVQNTEMGKNTLEELMTMTRDQALKAEMLRQQKRYRELNQEAHTALAALGQQAKGQSMMAKMNVSMGIRAKTMRDKSTRNIAEMLAEGSGQGVIDCLKAQEDYPQASEGAKDLTRQLLGFQRQAEEKWRSFI